MACSAMEEGSVTDITSSIIMMQYSKDAITYLHYISVKQHVIYYL